MIKGAGLKWLALFFYVLRGCKGYIVWGLKNGHLSLKKMKTFSCFDGIIREIKNIFIFDLPYRQFLCIIVIMS